MNVLVAADYRSPYGGNFIGSFLDLGMSLNARGDNLLFLFPLMEEKERFWISYIKNAGHKVFFIDMSGRKDIFLKELSDIISANQIDLIHSNFGMLYHDFLFNKPVFGKTRLLFHDHMGFQTNRSLSTQKYKNFLRSVLFLKNRIGVISVMKEKDSSYSANIGKHWFIPNGISFRRCLSESLSREARRAERGIPEKTKLVLAFGWNFEIKGIDIAVQSVEIARKKDPSIELAVVIQTEKITEHERNQLLIKTGLDPDKTPWLHFWPGIEDVYSYHRAADVFLSCSRTEAFSFAILEAISQRCPVVMSDITGTRWAKQYTKCLSFHDGDISDCSKKITDAILLTQKTSDNSEDIIGSYSIDKWRDKVLAVYDSMMKVQP